MSLFKEPFDPEVAAQLAARQKLISKENRSPSDLVYLNSKTAWVQLRSSVDIVGSDSKKAVGLAQNNVLTGGVLNPLGGQKSGLGKYAPLYKFTNSGPISKYKPGSFIFFLPPFLINADI
jgi:hypothetical protein